MLMNNSLNSYELLGISKSATNEEIKAAYKKQMKFWHPDVNKSSDAIDMSSKINEAKEVLLDPVKRRDYNDYLDKKVNESYQRYTNVRKTTSNSHEYNQYQETSVGKWDYFKEWLKKSNTSFLRKLFGTIGVMLESLLCLLLRILIIVIAVTCNIISVIIRTIYSYLAPVFGIILVFLAISISVNGFKETFNSNKELTRGTIIFAIIYIVSFILPILSSIMLSAKTFDILYNKIDINLFKLCVGYKN